MIWTHNGDAMWKSGPYYIARRIRGMEVWWNGPELRCLKREIPTLAEAKKFVEGWVKREEETA